MAKGKKAMPRVRHIHVDTYKKESDDHQRKNAENQMKWAKERRPLEIPSDKLQPKRAKRAESGY